MNRMLKLDIFYYLPFILGKKHQKGGNFQIVHMIMNDNFVISHEH